eukprot:SAG11_NODE_19546_length_464_cov_1.126027_1_plen_23_part_10
MVACGIIFLVYHQLEKNWFIISV